jgi:heme-degrading monooxygenase HmoA
VVLEVAILDVIPSMQTAFEEAFLVASPLIAASPGYISHELRRCVETANRYALLVQWQTLEDHTVGISRVREVFELEGIITQVL